ncbi:MAG: pitrilysin family protein [Bacteroidales bacterium]|nr:pitrilysin family protein [Bacteroidales bacterium]MDP3002995.1 pitrilysin family protein [Bacteroidales bacterium]
MNKMRIFTKIFAILTVVLISSACNKAPDNEKLNITYEKYVMQNGLQVILHTDHSDPMISYAIMYHVGSSREVPGKTGFAHLFEHLLFVGSENVTTGTFDKIIESAGGSNNGFTTRDITTYYEMFPKNALEKVLWLESDRMGFFINSVTQRSLAIQQNVVQNEKRQSVDNSPYGFTDYVISKNLYPASHPYNWEVIGEMEDLKSATLDDVKSYYEHFYGPNNATLVLAGDFNPDSVKLLINKYFGEIKAHGEVASRSAEIPTLEKTIKLYHEDNFANVPEINLVWPVSQAYQKDAYALDFLAKILADGKKAPLYKVLVKEKQLTSRTSAHNNSGELAGEFTISVRANEGKTLKEIEEAVSEAFNRFEKEGITEKDVERIKASSEKGFYDGLSSVYDKSIQLAFYNTFLNDPGYIEKDIENIKAVTLNDVKMVYEKYIKGKPHIATSFVPKGKPEMIAENSVPAGVKEENINEASQVEIAKTGDDKIVKTASSIDRTVEPPVAKEPEVNVPEIWKATLANGIQVYGIQNKELPLVDISLVINGGVYQDKIALPGVAGMVSSVLPQGTKNRTPEELEEEIELLGSSINMDVGREEISMDASTLSRNFEKTLSLMKEILLEPRWDSAEFSMAQTRTKNLIIQSEAKPRSVANQFFFKLLYGTDHIFGYNSMGTRELIDKIKMDDLKAWYEKNFSPSVTKIQVAGNVLKEQVLAALKPLETEWKAKEVKLNSFPVPPNPEKSVIYFVDIPGSRQSVIYIGYLALSRDNPDYVRTDFINYRLGGAFTSILNQILREEKGFTYGASSYFMEQRVIGPFIASTSVRSDATFESIKIFKDEMEKYRNGISEGDLQFIKNCMILSNALRFETNGSLVEMLSTMSKYGLTDDYIKKEENIIKNITLEEHKAITDKYIVPDRMYYVIVGDAATQMKPLEKIGFGKPVLVKP